MKSLVAMIPRRELSVQEYNTLYGVELSIGELAALRRVSPKIIVQPSYERGAFDITATSWIGSVQAGSIALQVVPKIHIRRVLFLMLYALDHQAWRDTSFAYRRDDTLIEVIAPGFVHQVHRTLARGLLRGYRQEEDSLLTVRGSVRFADQIRRRFGRFPPAEVTFDDYTEDIVENQLLRGAIEKLGRLRLRSMEVRRSLRAFDWELQNVRLVDYDPRNLPQVHFTHLNSHYRPAIRLAELILSSVSFRFEHGAVQSSSFLVDMNAVFEDFVRVALGEALGVKGDSFPKGARGYRLWLDRGRRVKLEPDLSWWVRGRCVFVGDVKYKVTAGTGAKNADAYQVLSYTVATNLETGLLIYAEGEVEEHVHDIQCVDKKIEVRTLDLALEPDQLLRSIRSIADRIRLRSMRERSAA